MNNRLLGRKVWERGKKRKRNYPFALITKQFWHGKVAAAFCCKTWNQRLKSDLTNPFLSENQRKSWFVTNFFAQKRRSQVKRPACLHKRTKGSKTPSSRWRGQNSHFLWKDGSNSYIRNKNRGRLLCERKNEGLHGISFVAWLHGIQRGLSPIKYLFCPSFITLWLSSNEQKLEIPKLGVI